MRCDADCQVDLCARRKSELEIRYSNIFSPKVNGSSFLLDFCHVTIEPKRDCSKEVRTMGLYDRDWGTYGKGMSWYAHYMQAFNETMKDGKSSGSGISSSNRLPTRREIKQMTPEELRKLNESLDKCLAEVSVCLVIAIIVLVILYSIWWRNTEIWTQSQIGTESFFAPKISPINIPITSRKHCFSAF